MTGRIILLNGAPRSGKSSIAAVIQREFDGVWINLGVDAWRAITPEACQPGVGLRPGGERPDLEPDVRRLYGALFGAIAAVAESGINVVSDLGIHDDYSDSLGILEAAAQIFSGANVVFVGVRCPIEEIMQRRNRSPGTYVHGPEWDPPAPVLRWQQAVHVPGIYDLEVDTSQLSPEECAFAILQYMSNENRPDGITRAAEAKGRIADGN